MIILTDQTDKPNVSSNWVYYLKNQVYLFLVQWLIVQLLHIDKLSISLLQIWHTRYIISYNRHLHIDKLSISLLQIWHTRYIISYNRHGHIRIKPLDILGLSRICDNRLPYMTPSNELNYECFISDYCQHGCQYQPIKL